MNFDDMPNAYDALPTYPWEEYNLNRPLSDAEVKKRNGAIAAIKTFAHAQEFGDDGFSVAEAECGDQCVFMSTVTNPDHFMAGKSFAIGYEYDQ